MKTLIELYVNEQYDNLLAALVFKPERVVFVCCDQVPDKQTRRSILSFLAGVRQDIKVEFVLAGSRSVGSLFKKLGEICAKYPDSAVELSGGSSAALIAAESYCAKHKTKAFFFDQTKNRFVSVRGMRNAVSKSKLPKIDIPTLFRIGGAKVTGTGHSVKQLEGNIDTVRSTLKVYSNNLEDWNANSEYLQYCCKHYYDGATQIFSAPSTIRNNSMILLANRRILSELEIAGAVSDLSFENESVFFRFRNSFMRDVLTTVGMCLELMIYIGALDSGKFDSAAMSVVFDWDGVLHTDQQDTVNEVDVVMTKGLLPVFVSCKSARPDTRDLYEIWYLAHRFGGSRAKAVLATAVPLSADAWATYIRARDMGIIVIERRDILEFKGRDWLDKKLGNPKWLTERPSR